MKTMKSSVQSIINSMLIIFLLTACQNAGKPRQETKTAKTKKTASSTQQVKANPTKSKTKKTPFVRLTEDNVVEELTRYGKENPETLVLMKTPKGNMKIKLYTNTPLHRANFIRLIKNNFYENTEFYRVVEDFMIQGGDNDDWERQSLKNKMGLYTLPAEFNEENIHQKGALSMAREYENNPEKRSVPFEFFIVQGTPYTEGEIRGAEMQYDLKIRADHKQTYMTLGGTPHLDGKHTVFGQVVEGLEVIDKIAAVPTDAGDWPIEEITIDLEILP